MAAPAGAPAPAAGGRRRPLRSTVHTLPLSRTQSHTPSDWLIDGASFIFTFQSHSYHQSKFLNSSNFITGSIYTFSDNITSYFGLREENNRLVEENKRLRDRLFNNVLLSPSRIDSTSVNYEIIRGRAINNSYADQRNYITINKGENDSIAQDMGVITDKGILGIVENTSNNFSTVQSILSDKSTR